MKISLEHLGPVDHAEFELKPLTVFIGDNRQGKTIALSVSTAMLSDYVPNAYICNQVDWDLNFNEFEQLYQDLTRKGGRAEIDIVNFIQKNITKYYNDIGNITPKLISTLLGCMIPTESMKISFSPSREDINTIISKVKESSYQQAGFGLQVTKEKGASKLHVSVDSGIDFTSLQKDSIMKALMSLIIKPMICDVYMPRLFFFPSERTSFALLIGQIIQQTKVLTTPENPPFYLSHSLESYMGLILNIFFYGSLSQRREKKTTQKLLELHTLFIDTITKDEIILSNPEPGISRKIQIKAGNEKTAMDFQIASSGVKSLIGFALYLQYWAQPGDHIVIDEPEQNLHPNQQAAFVEFLATLINNGIRISLTTHSPYIIEHLQNLIYAHDLTDKEEVISQLNLKRADSLIDKDKVGVYLFQNGTAEDIIEDGTINWQTFCDTANYIGNITSLVYEKRKTSMKTE